MYQKDKILTEIAEKRLQTIREFTQFGAGFKIAMRDLEIRGAGNLFGINQHGHMDSVGYEMYCKLLDLAIKEMRGLPLDDFETLIDLVLDAYISEIYIPDEGQRLEIYKKISHIGSLADYTDVLDEMEDRFGVLPASAQNLLDIALLKARAHEKDIISIKQKPQNVVITFKGDAKVDPQSIASLVKNSGGRLKFTLSTTPYLTYKIGGEQVIGGLTDVVLGLLV